MNSIVEIKDVWKKFPMRRERPGFKEFVVNLPKFLNSNSEFSLLGPQGDKF